MQDNQNRDLEATKRWQALEVQHHQADIARMEKSLETTKFADWAKFEEVDVLRIENSRFVAVPTTGRKNSKKFDIINVETREFVCQVSKAQVRRWLVKAE